MDNQIIQAYGHKYRVLQDLELEIGINGNSMNWDTLSDNWLIEPTSIVEGFKTNSEKMFIFTGAVIYSTSYSNLTVIVLGKNKEVMNSINGSHFLKLREVGESGFSNLENGGWIHLDFSNMPSNDVYSFDWETNVKMLKYTDRLRLGVGASGSFQFNLQFSGWLTELIT